MNVTSERIPQSQVILRIEVEPERVDRSMDQAYHLLSTRTRVPGFRQGKVPRATLERYIGRATLLQEALDLLVPDVYSEAVAQEALNPIAGPNIEIESLDPVVVKATVSLSPTVTLGKYTTVRVKPTAITIAKAEFADAIADLQRRYATLAPVARTVKDGDVVSGDVRAAIGDMELFHETEAQFQVKKEGSVSLPGFSDRIIGLKKGDHTFTIDVASDFDDPTLAGKTVEYQVTLSEVKEERLPKLDDSFAKTVGEGFASVAALRKSVEEDLRATKQRAANEQLENEALDAIVQKATVEYPPVLLEREIDQLMHNRLGHADDHAALRAHLAQIGRTEEDLTEELRPEAIQRLLRSLVLAELSEAEHIEVPETDINAQIEEMAGIGPQAEQLRQTFATESGRDMLRRSLVTRSTLERIATIARGDAPTRTTKASAATKAKPAARATPLKKAPAKRAATTTAKK